jgi:membrane-associated protease RseP (regulator of RpoE activity)
VTASVAPERGSGGFYFGDDFLPMPPTPPSAPAAPAPPPAPAIPWSFDRDFGWMTFAGSEGLLGVSVESLGDQLAAYFGVKDGVLVRTVREGSPAAAAGVKAGDVITSVNGQRIERPSDLASEIRRIGSGGEFTLEISRDRKAQTVKGKLGAREDRIRTRTRTIV